MNYKNIFKNQEYRLKLLEMLNFINDETMIKLQYFVTTGKRLNLKTPKRFTEKIQWYKLNYRYPIMTICADKYRVREYVKNKGYEYILVPLLRVYSDSTEIQFEELPNKFVLKTTNSSHTNIFCTNKKSLDVEHTKRQLNKWLERSTISPGREWAYYGIKPQIICEEYIERDKNNDLVDYKFFCFNGEIYCLYVINNKYSLGEPILGIYDSKFNIMDCGRADFVLPNKALDKPDNFNEMINIAKELSRAFPHVRVDLYNVNGKIYFGELTFYDGSGYKCFNPDSFDYTMGEKFILPKIKNPKNISKNY